MNTRQQTYAPSALLVQAERELAKEASRNDWIVVAVCLIGSFIVGVFA